MRKVRRRNFRFDWKFWVSLLLGVIGVAPVFLAVPSVSIGPTLDPSDVFSTPVEISNVGILPLNDVSVATYIRNIQSDDDTLISEDAAWDYGLSANAILPGEGRTVPIRTLIAGRTRRILSADVSLLVFYRGPYWTSILWKRRKAFRFQTVQRTDGTLVFQQQPAEDTLERYDALTAHATK